LENIVDPSATLAESFRVSTIVLGDGRVLSGVIQGETPRTLALQTATDRLVLERNAVREIRPTTRSLMPEGLLDVLSEQETRDLMAYLMSRT
jgi:putative heme-binding domain-containing protein